MGGAAVAAAASARPELSGAVVAPHGPAARVPPRRELVPARGAGDPRARELLVRVAAVALVLARGRPARTGAATGAVLAPGRALTAAAHRERAAAAAAAGNYAEAVRERLRAVVRELEARGVLDPRAGRTAGDVARDAGLLVPALATPLRQGATVFDEVWYGGRSADAASYAVLVEVDRIVTGTAMVLA